MRCIRLSGSLAAATALVTACIESPQPDADLASPTPVAVLTLQERDFRRHTRLTGSVALYRKERVAFEVDGRVLYVLDLGREAIGPALDETGALVRGGDVVAALDDARYRFAVETLQARLDSEHRSLEAVDAELERAKKTLKRQESILEQGAGNQQAVDDATSTYRSLLAKQGQQDARVRETREQLKQAEEDLKDCVLVAPFSGRITEIHVSQGAVVEAGTPVVTLSLMDPIQVQVAVSANADRRIQTGDPAVLYPRNPLAPEDSFVEVPALVFEKGSVADPDTHTFRIDLIARNRRLRVGDFVPDAAGLPVVSEFLPTARRYEQETGPVYVPVNSVYRDQGRDYVLRLPGVGFHADSRRGAFGHHRPDKIPVHLGDDYFTVVKWTFRSIAPGTPLREGDFLVLNPDPSLESGLAIGRPQWLFRPGDLVPLRFRLEATPRGFYVPVNAITEIRGSPHVFVIGDGVAYARPVTVHESHEELRRIEGPHLLAGAQVVVDGVHYLSDRESVRVVPRSGELR